MGIVEQDALGRGSTAIGQQDYAINPMSWTIHIEEYSPNNVGSGIAWWCRKPQTVLLRTQLMSVVGGSHELITVDIYVTPNYLLGAIAEHDAKKKSLLVVENRTSKHTYHFPEALPVEHTVTYDDTTLFRVEGEDATADVVLNQTGNVIQVHRRGSKTILLGSSRQQIRSIGLAAKGWSG